MSCHHWPLAFTVFPQVHLLGPVAGSAQFHKPAQCHAGAEAAVCVVQVGLPHLDAPQVRAWGLEHRDQIQAAVSLVCFTCSD